MASETTSERVDPHTLLAHGAWLRRLAQSLIRDSAAAEDLVQETWVAALRHPPSADRPLRPWLRRVLENAARFRWRGERNRAARELAVSGLTDDATPSSDELLARHEAQQQLARLVSELEEPFRTTVLLCYGEGLTPTQIAQRLGVPAGTVRWRLKSALDRLRERLDEAHGGERRAWMLVLAPLARGGDGAAPVAPAPAVTATPWLAPVLVVLVAVLIVVVVLVARDARSRAGRSDASRAAGAAGERVSRARAAELDPPVDRLAALAAGHPAGWIAQEGAPSRRVAGRVVDGGAPRSDVVVRLVSEASLAGLAPALERRTDAAGRFDFGTQVARPIALGAGTVDRLAAIRRIDLRDPRAATDAIELALTPCAAAYHGKVLDVGGSPVAHARLLREDVVGTEAGADGTYELCVPPSAALVEHLQVVVRADGYGAIAIEAFPSGRVRRDLVLTPEASIAGRAIDDRGEPVADAKIWIEPDVDGRSPPSEQTATLLAVTDVAGRFRFTGVAVGRHRVGGAARSLTAQRQTIVVAAGGSEQITVRMGATGRVRGRVLRRGAPVAGARVSVLGDLSDTAVSQADGSFVLDRVPAGEMRFVATPYAVTSPERVAVVGGAEVDVVFEVDPMARLVGTVSRHGTPVPYARVNVNGPTPAGGNADAQGRYAIDGLRAGSYGYFADDTRRGAYVAGRDVEIAEGETRTLDLELSGGARVTGMVVDGRGRPVDAAFVRLVGADGDEGRCVSDAAGAFDCGQMWGGGLYMAQVFAGDDATTPYPFVGDAPAPVMLTDGYARVDGLRLAVDPRRLAIRGTVTDGAGTPIADARVQAWGVGGRRDRWTTAPSGVTDAEGAFTIARLAPGTYSLEVATLDGARNARREVDAGAAEVALVVERPTCTDRSGTVRLRAEPTGIRERPPGRVVWGERVDRIELLGWDVPSTVRRGQPFEIVTYYRTLAPLDRPWTMFVHIDGVKARHLGDHEPLGGTCPTTTWRPGDILVDRFTTTIKSDHVSPGRYTVWIGFFTGWAPSFRNFEVSAAPAGMQDATGRIQIADVIVAP